MRKVLSFVLVLSLVLGSFSMAFAATPAPAGLSDIADSANADAIQVAYDLGIVTGNPDGTFLPEKSVTRAEFAAMITRALAVPESALAGYTATTFKDTVGYGWAVPYLAFAQSKGIMLGDGNGNVMPGRTINVNEAMTMVLRAVGYTSNSAELVGTWPSNYVTLAQNAGLYDDVASIVNVDKANAAQIIYNALTVQKVAVNADGETKYLVDKDDNALNLLNTNLGCETTTGQTLDGSFYGDAVMNITDKMGAYGTEYRDGDSLVAFTVESTALTGSMSDGKFKVGDKKYSFGSDVDLDAAVKYITNAGVATTTSGVTIAAVEAMADGGEVTLNVDLSGSTIKEIYSVVAWAADYSAVAKDADVEDISEYNELLGVAFAEDDDDAIQMNQFSLVGVASLDKIAKDDVVYVYSDGDVIRKVAVGTSVITGTVTEDGGDYSVVADKEYEYAKDYLVSAKGDAYAELGSDVEFSLDAYGYVYAVEETGSTPDTYAMVKALDDPSNDFDNVRVKLYTSDDATKTFNFVDWEDVVDQNNATFAATTISTAGMLIAYAVDADGYIDTVNTSVTSSSVNAKVKSTKVFYNGVKDLTISSDVVVFTDDYGVTTINNIELNTTAGAIDYITDDGKVVAMVVPKILDNKDTDSVFGVVNTETLVKDGDTTVEKLVGFIDGAAATKTTSENGTYTDSSDVQLYEFVLDGSGVVKDATTVAGTAFIGTGEITKGGINADATVFSITGGTTKYTVDSDAVVYKAILKVDGTVDKYELSKLSAIKALSTIYVYDTKGSDWDGIGNVVIWAE